MRNIFVCVLLGMSHFFFPPLFAQSSDPPTWMKYLVAEEITDEGYLESQKVLDAYSISTIRVSMDPGDYEDLINNTGSDEYLQADMSYESPEVPLQILENVGIRLRGAAARGSAKKSFKISFQEFGNDDREFYSLQKLNLNCDFQDPHLMRAKLCTDLFRLMGVDAARVGYSMLYINDDYRGLFANYEQFDKSFLKTRFEDENGNLYKCDGAPMTLGSGGYTLTTNEDEKNYSDIHDFINVLNTTGPENFKEEIERVFNVDEMLMYIASNVLLGAWDDYWVLVKNYYLYHDPYTDQFNYIPHDFDGSLGTYWYPKDMDVAYEDVYDWSPNSNRPMVEKLLEVPEYKDRYTHFLRMLCMYAFSMEGMETEIDRTADMIRDTLIADPYWGWNDGDFDTAMEESLPGSNVLYGLKEYIRLRRNSALEQLEAIGPYIQQLERLPLLPGESNEVSISHLVVDMAQVTKVNLVYEGTSLSGQVEMSEGEDFVYSARIPAQSGGGEVRYYVEATNSEGEISRYPANGEWETYPINYLPPGILINEILASNDSTIQDNYGEYDDFLELYNTENESVNLMGMYVSDDLLEPRKWRLGNLDIPANGFLLLWADDDTEQGSDHLGFKLSASGEELGLFDRDEYANLGLDSLSYASLDPDISLGRTEDGSPTWFLFLNPTPGWGNRDTLITPPDLGELVDITDLGGTISEANDDSPLAESIENIIDNNFVTKYLTLSESTWIDYSMEERSLVSAYTISSANDAPERDPSTWEFQAFDEEADDWLTLHKVDNEPQWPQRFQKKEFFFSNTEWYSHYRLNVASAHGVDIVQIAELEIFGELGSTTHSAASWSQTEPIFSLYPNPVADVLNIQCNSGMKSMTMFDIAGRLVMQKDLDGSSRQTVKTDALQSGVYIVHIECVTGEIIRSRIIKN